MNSQVSRSAFGSRPVAIDVAAALLMLGLAGRIDLTTAALLSWTVLTNVNTPDKSFVQSAQRLRPLALMLETDPDSPLNNDADGVAWTTELASDLIKGALE